MARSAVLAVTLVAAGEAARVSKKRQDFKRNASISIVNGEPADECEWKHQVGLTSSPGGRPWCGGQLISADWVLTAAHCLEAGGSRINVLAGEWSTSQTSGNEQNRYSQRTFIHPWYNSRTLEYDFGLMKLESPMTLNECVGVVRLPTADVADGTNCWITGWGTLRSGGSQPTTLQEAQVTVIGNSECMSDYGYGSGEITDSMLCAQGRNANGDITDACQGDSGGPLVCEEGGSWVIHGATSWGYGCAGATYPGVWARVYNQLTWIEETMNGIFPTPAPTPPPPTPMPTPAPPPGSWVLYGSGCQMEYNCISSSNYPEEYGNEEECTVELFGDIPFRTDAFSTESRYDFLRVGGVGYSGTSGPPSGSYTGVISWSTDVSVTKSGWRLCRTDMDEGPTPEPTPAPPPGSWQIVGDGCVMDGSCITSNNHPSNYGNSEECTVELSGAVALTTEAFNVESRYDFLTLGGVSYDGTDGPPSGSYTGTIVWRTDSSVTKSGWRLCRTD